MSPVLQWVSVVGVAAVGMFSLWLVQRRTDDAGIVDVGWTAGVGLAAIAFALFGEGYEARRILLGVLAGAWSFRLATYIYFDRVHGREEDRRYRNLRNLWGDNAQRNFLLFFQAQALLIGICALPALVVAYHTDSPLAIWDYLGASIFLISIVGETVSDRQLQQFRSNPDNRGTTCRVGLWGVSRHPNYFFEWIHWLAYVVMAIGSPWWLLTLIGPTLMLFFLFKVTGIPATEAQALKSRGDDYRRYQESVSMFVPWFPKKESA